MSASTEQTLHEALAILGIRHERDPQSEADGRHSWFGPQGEALGRFDAFEGWEKLKEITSAVEAERAA